MKRYVFVLACVLLFVAIAFATDVKIGVCLPFTGDGMADANGIWNAFQLANELMPSVGDYKLVLIKENDNTDPKQSQKVTEQLIGNGAVVLIGYPWSSLAIAAASVAEKAKIPMVSAWSTNPLTTKGRKYISRVCFIDPFQGEVAANFAIKTLKVKNAVLIVDRKEPYCTGLATYFKKAFSKLKGRLLTSLYFKRGDSESILKNLAQKALKLNPDMIYIPAYQRELGTLVKNLRNSGYKGVLITGDTGGLPDVPEYAGDKVNGLYFTDHFNAEAAKTKAANFFITKFKEKYGKIPEAGPALGWDTYLIVYNAIKSCVSAGKEPNPENINYYIRHTRNLEGATGNLTIDPQTGDPTKSAVMDVWKKGKVRLYTVVNP